MSDRVSSNSFSAPSGDTTGFDRLSGLVSLTLGVVLGPIVVLWNQAIIYSVDSWICRGDLRAILHVIPAVCFVIVAIAGLDAYRNWRAVGRGVDDEHEAVTSRVRFLAFVGMSICAISALLILAQWLALFVFRPCQRA
jgi:hypothetical protein